MRAGPDRWGDDVGPFATDADAKWRSLMTQGNEAFRAGNLIEASRRYLLALEDAERRLDHAFGAGAMSDADIAPALVVAGGNAANAYACQQRQDYAQAVLQRVTARMRQAIGDDDASPAVRMACVQHIDQACSHLVSHMRQNKAVDDDIAEEISANRTAVLNCLDTMKKRHFH